MDTKQIDSYLFGEMSKLEREQVEDRFIGNDELFAEIADRENELVDAYVRDGLSADERIRFERSFEVFPARREKLSNARLLREFIESERQDAKTITIAERSGYFSQLAQMIAFGSPSFQFVSLGLILILAIASLFLLRENRRLGSLESELAAANQRETELVTQIDTAQDASGALTEDLVSERQRIRQLETDIAKLRTQGTNGASTETNRIKPTIATIVLSAGFRGGGPRPVEQVELSGSVEKISAVLILDDVPQGSLVSVRLNGEVLAKDLRVQKRANGESRVTVMFPRSRLQGTQNELVAYDARDNKLGAGYLFSISERK